MKNLPMVPAETKRNIVKKVAIEVLMSGLEAPLWVEKYFCNLPAEVALPAEIAEYLKLIRLKYLSKIGEIKKNVIAFDIVLNVDGKKNAEKFLFFLDQNKAKKLSNTAVLQKALTKHCARILAAYFGNLQKYYTNIQFE